MHRRQDDATTAAKRLCPGVAGPGIARCLRRFGKVALRVYICEPKPRYSFVYTRANIHTYIHT